MTKIRRNSKTRKAYDGKSLFHRLFQYKKTTVLCGLFLTAAITFSGCQSKAKDQSLAMSQSETAAESIQDSGGQEEIETAKLPLPSAASHVKDAGNSPESEAVVDTSPLNGDITRDNGFADTDEVVYVTENLVNIRSDCTTDSRIVAQLNIGDSLRRTGLSEGWSRVLYGDQICFVSSEFLTKDAPEQKTSQDVKALSNEASAAAETADSSAPVSNGRIVAIDPGHQAKGNSEKEPIGPGSATMKAKVAGGAEGIATKLPEYKLTLAVSQKLKRILEERGYQVVMIRESNDVNISNAERAEIANKSGASVFVRIHANSLDNSSVRGVLAMCQTENNPYNGKMHSQSYYLSRLVTDGISAATGFKNRGVQETDTMSGINWSSIPVSIVEMGFMSNPEEDQLMAQDEYQEKIAAGIAAGIDAYFGG